MGDMLVYLMWASAISWYQGKKVSYASFPIAKSTSIIDAAREISFGFRGTRGGLTSVVFIFLKTLAS